ncbi:DUF3017 domain-containing protein [Nocardioides montaniterrae]
MTDDQQPEQTPEPRRYPSTIGGAFYLGVLGLALVGILLVGLGVDWRIGIRVLAIALATDGLMRASLKDRDAGMLAVRSRWLDATIMFVVAAVLIILSVAIPDQPV